VTDWSFEEPLTAVEVARAFGVAVNTVYRWADTGRLATRINRRGRGRMYSGAQVEQLLGERSLHGLRADRRSACYQAALQELRRRHPREFAALYDAELAACEEASPVPAGDAGDQTSPLQEGDHDDSIEPV
jgi:DNA-binding transcriptional MerR regulator